MARVFTEGFESGDLLFFTAQTGIIASSVVRSGAYSAAGTSGASILAKTITAASEAYFRFAIYTPGSSSIFRWLASTVELGSIRINSASRLIEIYTGGSTLVKTGGTPISANRWYLIEVYVKIADSGTVTVKIDGTQDCTFSGDTKPGADTAFSVAQYLPQSNVGYFDDLAMNDTTGAVDNSWCGDGRIIALIPNADGDLSQLTNTAGNSTANWGYVDERPMDSDTSYVESGTVDRADLYNLTASGLSLTDGVINRVWAESRSKDTVGAGGLISLAIKTGGTEYDGADTAIGISYAAVKGPEHLVNPGTSAAWTIAQLDALQAGVKVRS